jgi:hypothetical protein
MAARNSSTAKLQSAPDGFGNKVIVMMPWFPGDLGDLSAKDWRDDENVRDESSWVGGLDRLTSNTDRMLLVEAS